MVHFSSIVLTININNQHFKSSLKSSFRFFKANLISPVIFNRKVHSSRPVSNYIYLFVSGRTFHSSANTYKINVGAPRADWKFIARNIILL